MLPNITPLITFILILISIIPVLFVMLKKEINRENKLLIGLALSAYGFFMFGWHVHEKALLMIFLPMLLLFFRVWFKFYFKYIKLTHFFDFLNKMCYTLT